MSIIQGKDAAVWIADAGGTARDLSAWCDGVETSFDRPVIEVSTFGQSAANYAAGMPTNSFTITGKYDNAATATPDQYLTGLQQGTVTAAFTIFPGGSASGRPYNSGAAWITSYKRSVPVDGIITFSADFTVNGTVTRGTA